MPSAFRSPTVWLAGLNVIVAILATYVSLRLEPLYVRLQQVEERQERTVAAQSEHENLSRAMINDYIAFKAQTIEILRQQNQELEVVKQDLREIRRRP